jgi:hypothetical protein
MNNDVADSNLTKVEDVGLGPAWLVLVALRTAPEQVRGGDRDQAFVAEAPANRHRQHENGTW